MSRSKGAVEKWGVGMENGAELTLAMCSDCKIINVKLEDPQDGFPPSSIRASAFCLLQV